MKHRICALCALALAVGAVQAQPSRDPFARPAPPSRTIDIEPEAPQILPQLRAVMITPGGALANINGHILAVGERFGDYQLIKVEEHGVTLTRRGVKTVLALDKASRK